MRAPAASPEARTVLLVDDDEQIRKVFAMLLEIEHYRVLTAANGHEALEVIEREGAPGVVLLDLMMPIMDGHDFLKALRGSSKHAQVPVVVFTAAETGDISGANAQVAKPIDSDDLLRTLESVMA